MSPRPSGNAAVDREAGVPSRARLLEQAHADLLAPYLRLGHRFTAQPVTEALFIELICALMRLHAKNPHVTQKPAPANPLPHKSLLQAPLLFVHVPKTAGTTIRMMVECLYPEENILRITDPAVYEQEGFPKRALFVSGHVQTYFRNYFHTPPHLMTVLRDPVERIASAYRYWRSLPAPHPSDASLRHLHLAHRLSMNDFMLSDDPVLEGELCSFHCRWIGSLEQGEHSLETLLANAHVVLRDAFWFGIVEKMPESLDLLSKLLALPPQAHESRLNATPVREARRELPPLVEEKVRDRNQHDYTLLALASAALKDRVEAAIDARWAETRERRVPSILERPSRFDMREAIIGSGWWAREEQDALQWRFALRRQDASLWFWWPLQAKCFVAMVLPHVQNVGLWNRIAIGLAGRPKPVRLFAAKWAQVAIIEVSADEVAFDRLTEITLGIAGSDAENPVGFEHSDQTGVSLASIRWFAATTDDMPVELLSFLIAMGVKSKRRRIYWAFFRKRLAFFAGQLYARWR